MQGSMIKLGGASLPVQRSLNKTIAILHMVLRLLVRRLPAFLWRRLRLAIGSLANRPASAWSNRPLIRTFENRFFSLRRWHLLLGACLSLKTFTWGLRTFERLRPGGRQAALRRRMRQASSYQEWSSAAEELEKLTGQMFVLPFHQARGLQRKARSLKRLREAGDVVGLMWSMRQVGSLPRVFLCFVLPCCLYHYTSSIYSN
jgi:hypothetical protein